MESDKESLKSNPALDISVQVAQIFLPHSVSLGFTHTLHVTTGSNSPPRFTVLCISFSHPHTISPLPLSTGAEKRPVIIDHSPLPPSTHSPLYSTFNSSARKKRLTGECPGLSRSLLAWPGLRRWLIIVGI